MKRLVSVPGSFILLTAAVICTIGAIVSGFGIDVEIWTLAIIWGVVAFALPVSSLIWRGKGVMILLLPILGVALWRSQAIVEGAKGIIHLISFEYSKWLVVPVLFPDNTATAGDLSAFLAIAGVLLATLLYFAICLRRSTFLAVLLTVPFILLTFIITFTQPDRWYLIGILTVYLTLLIGNSIHTGSKEHNARLSGATRRVEATHLNPAPHLAPAPAGEMGPNATTRRKDTPQWGKRTKKMRIYTALLGASLLILVAYLIVPPGSYIRSEHVDSINSAIRLLADRAGISRLKTGVGWPSSYSEGIWRFNTESVSIADAGARKINDVGMMEINVTEPGTYYIRGYAMQGFDGRTWTDATYTPGQRSRSDDAETFALTLPAWICGVYNLLAQEAAMPELLMSIERTGDVSPDVNYYPYYTFPGNMVDDFNWLFFNPDVSVLEIADRLPGLEIPAERESLLNLVLEAINSDYYGYNQLAGELFLDIDSGTKDGLLRIAQAAGIDPDASRAEIADMVAEYISSAGRYTLSPYVTPEGEDFALHFLQTSKQGYCIHFATAAVLMLRALDVPARFVSGFVVTVPPGSAGEGFEVTDRNAHAWVEVYYDNVGWLMLEVTPPASGSGIPGGRPHAGGGYSQQQGSGETGRAEHQDDMMPEGLLPTERPQAAPGLAPGQGGGQGSQAGPGAAAIALWVAVPAAITGGLIAALIVYRRKTRRMLDRRFTQADTNESVIYIWKYLHRLDRYVVPPGDIEGIALKARFSRHRITPEERAGVVEYAVRYGGELYALSNVFRRLWLIWAIGVKGGVK